MAYIGKQPTPVPLSASDLDDDIISLAKMAAGTDGNLITYDTSANPVAVATGSDGQVLTSAGAGNPCLFEAAAGGGAWNFISKTTISSDSTILINSGIDSTYDLYMFQMAISGNTTNISWWMQFYVGGAIVTASDYRYSNYGTHTAGSVAHYYDDDHTAIKLNSNGCHVTETHVYNFLVYLYNPSNTTYWTQLTSEGCTVNNDDKFYSNKGGGVLEQTAAVTGVNFFPDSGNFRSGHISLYGLAKS